MSVNKPIQAPLASAPGGFEIANQRRIVRSFNSLALRALNELTARLIFDMDRATEGYGCHQNLVRRIWLWQAEDGDLVRGVSAGGRAEHLGRRPRNSRAHRRQNHISYQMRRGIGVHVDAGGGGQNVGYLDAGDILEYQVQVTKAGFYTVDFRTASLDGSLAPFSFAWSGTTAKSSMCVNQILNRQEVGKIGRPRRKLQIWTLDLTRCVSRSLTLRSI
jgi:hypothetical protein